MDPSFLFGDFDFGASFGDIGADFGQAVDFCAAFDTGFSNFDGSVSIVINDASHGGGRRRQDRRERRPNCHSRVESVIESA
jgi:hypothetical protein